MLSLAADITGNAFLGSLVIVDPVISEATVRAEWARLLPAIAPAVRARMTVDIQHSNVRPPSQTYSVTTDALLLDRPNYRYKVLRLLLGAYLEGDGSQMVKRLIEQIGASQTPIRQALADLKASGLCRSRSRGLEVVAEEIAMEMLARTSALPQTLRFLFERGAQIKSPATLLHRALQILGPNAPSGWDTLALSGTPVALSDVPSLDLLGTPRIDLVAHVPRTSKAFNTRVLRLLDDGLELEPSALAPAPVVVTLARAETRFVRRDMLDNAQCAMPMDVFLSLLDMRFREHALQYAAEIRR